MFRFTVVILLILQCLPAYAELDLKAKDPLTESAEYSYNQRFSMSNSLECIKQIRSALSSFINLTEFSRTKLPEKKVIEFGNTGWEIQNLGFHNWATSIEGTLYKQDYVIKKLKYELELEKSKTTKTNAKELKKAEEEFKTAEQKFQSFWNSFDIAD